MLSNSFSTFSHIRSKKALPIVKGQICPVIDDRGSEGRGTGRYGVWGCPHVLPSNAKSYQALAGAACRHSPSSESTNVGAVSTESDFSLFKEYSYLHLDFYASIQLFNSSDYR